MRSIPTGPIPLFLPKQKTMRNLFTLISILCCIALQAQNSIIKELGKNNAAGRVAIHQDSRIEALIGHSIYYNRSTNVSESATAGQPAHSEAQTIKSNGYRIQVYAGNNTGRAKTEAFAVASRVQEHFPDLTIYTTFISPRWLCRVGDYKSIEEADAMMRKLRATGTFKEVSIIKDQINITIQ